MMMKLLDCEWIVRQQNVLITDKSVTGKTWLGCCLSVQAARHGHSVAYHHISRLLEESNAPLVRYPARAMKENRA